MIVWRWQAPDPERGAFFAFEPYCLICVTMGWSTSL